MANKIMISLTMEEDIVKKLDAIARLEKRSRSNMVEVLTLKELLRRKNGQDN